MKTNHPIRLAFIVTLLLVSSLKVDAADSRCPAETILVVQCSSSRGLFNNLRGNFEVVASATSEMRSYIGFPHRRVSCTYLPLDWTSEFQIDLNIGRVSVSSVKELNQLAYDILGPTAAKNPAIREPRFTIEFDLNWDGTANLESSRFTDLDTGLGAVNFTETGLSGLHAVVFEGQYNPMGVGCSLTWLPSGPGSANDPIK